MEIVHTQHEDIGLLKEANDGLRTALEQLHAIGTHSSRLLSATDPSQILEATAAILPSTLPAAAMAASLVLEGNQRLQMTHHYQADFQIPELPPGTVDWVVERSQMTAVPLEEKLGAVVLPLEFQGRRFGWFAVFVEDGLDCFTEAASLALTGIGAHVSSALQNCMNLALQRKEADRLAKVLDFLEGTIASVDHGVFRIDSDGTVTLANRQAEAILGRAIPRDPPAHYAQLFPPELTRSVSAHLMAVRRSKRTEPVRASWRRADGKAIDLEVAASPLQGGLSGLPGIVLVCRNLEESLEIDRLRSLDRMKDNFLSLVSHELRTPLASILSYAEALRDGIVEEEEEKKEFLETIVGEGMRLAQLINDILDLSKIESGKMSFQFGSVDIGKLLSDSAAAVRKLAKDKGQTLIVSKDPEVTTAWGDHPRLIQVLVNFLSNSWKFTPIGGQITLEARCVENGVELSVSDTGMGMSNDDIPKIFQRFTQLGDQRDRPRGTGIGMTISKEIVEHHSSRIDVKSKLGHGSRFSFVLTTSAPAKA